MASLTSTARATSCMAGTSSGWDPLEASQAASLPWSCSTSYP